MPVVISRAGSRRRGSPFFESIPIAVFFDWKQAGGFMTLMAREGEYVFSNTPLPSEAFK